MTAKRSLVPLVVVLLILPVVANCHANRNAVAADPRIAQLTGTWRFIREEGRNIESGESVPAMAAEGLPGVLIYAPDGGMSVTIDRRPAGGTYWGYFGTFRIENDQVVHVIEGGSIAARGPRPANYRLEEGGRRLVISTLPNASKVVAHYTFERVGASQ